MGYEDDMQRLELVFDSYAMILKNVYSMEKIHGSSAFIEYKNGKLNYHAGCLSSMDFSKLFDEKKIHQTIKTRQLLEFRIQGEVYGEKIQGMKKTYGDKIRFVAFDARVADKKWMSVAQAEEFIKSFDQFDFVSYKIVPFDLKELSLDRDAFSAQAIKNGIQEPRLREGIVIRPMEELYTSDAKRIIFKFTSDAFKEQLHKKPIIRDLTKETLKQEQIKYASMVVEKYVLPMRFTHVMEHVLEKKQVKELVQKDIKLVLEEMVDDVKKDANSQEEINWNEQVIRLIKTRTAEYFQDYIKDPKYLEKLIQSLVEIR